MFVPLYFLNSSLGCLSSKKMNANVNVGLTLGPLKKSKKIVDSYRIGTVSLFNK